MRSHLHALTFCCLLALLIGGGDDGDGGATDAAATTDAAAVDAAPGVLGPAPPLRNPVVDLTDDQVATQALQMLGTLGGSDNCNACHSLTRQYLHHWRALSDDTIATCITDESVPTSEAAHAILDCLRMMPEDSSSPFDTKKLGVYSAAAHLDWFEYVFRRAYDGEYQAPFDEFKQRVAMPKGEDHPAYTQAQFDIVAEWFVRGVPQIDLYLPSDPPPIECTAGISSDVAVHVNEMQQSGWAAVNAENNLLMFGCTVPNDPLSCLDSYSKASETTFGVAWDVIATSEIRLLHQVDHRSAFWTRSSADGRYVAHGRSNGPLNGAIVDLQSRTVIPVNAFYDPGFFPDNSGFVFQRGRAYFCDQSLLDSNPTQIDFSEPECSNTNQVGLYQHVGTALGGGDYWAVDGPFVSDNGGFNPTTENYPAFFSGNSRITFTPMIHTGFDFDPGSSIDVSTPFEGDAVLSPSARLVISRLAGPDDVQLGFVMRRVDATPLQNGYAVEAPEVARYCFNGGKPGFSYDERWMVLHHYIEDSDAVELGFTGPQDPEFQPYRTSGAANLYLIDVVTGARTRITHMAPGQYALFPHFRSDGWIYFMVRTAGSTTEHIAASDAALVLQAP